MDAPLSQTLSTIALVLLAGCSLVGIFFNRPKYILQLYCAILFLFTSSAMGAIDKIILIYDRGVGILPVSIINIFLFLLFLYFLVRHIAAKDSTMLVESFVPGMCLNILLVFCIIYLSFGVLIDVPVKDVLGRRGIINIINLCLWVAILKWGVETIEQVEVLKRVALSCIFVSAFYGIIRFVFMGGDPANVYGNVEHLNVRITYQDIGQSLLFAFVFAYSIMMLLKGRLSGLKARLFYVVLSLLTIVNIVFSYRRNAWAGLIILLLWLLFVSDWKKKFVLLMIVSICIGSLGSYVVSKRFAIDDSTKKPTISGDFTRKGELSVEEGRFSELRNATLATMDENPLFGFGPWGRYTSNSSFGQFAYFTHSAIVHVLFKTGIIGLVLFVMPFVTLVFWVLRRRRHFPKNSRLLILSDAAFGGVLFMTPEFLFGTPVILFRHFQLVGFFIALVYFAYVFRNIEAGAVNDTEFLYTPVNGMLGQSQ